MRLLIEHEDRRDFVVAASERRVAAAESWSPKGDALFVAIPGNESEPRVIRYVVRG